MTVFAMSETGSVPHLAAGPVPPSREVRLQEAAQALEASFVAEMLKSASVGAVPSAFGGGVGEEQFASFLREAQARDIVRAGGIGLAETLFEAMKAQQDG